MKSILKSIQFGSLATAIVVTSVSLMPSTTIAQTPMQLAQRSPGVVYVRREVSGRAPGGRYQGGGSRNDTQKVCPKPTVPLTALVPFKEEPRQGYENSSIINVWGYTTAERPTFWVYVPYASATTIPAKFSIDTDEGKPSDETIYQTDVPLPKQAGVVAISLPKSAPSLQPGKRYRWFFSLDCTPPAATAASMERVYVEAVVIRENPTSALTSQLTGTPSLQNAIAFAQAGFWYDALTTLAQLRQQRPQDDTLLTAWKDLLSGVATSEQSRQKFNLDQISSQPLVN
ncbi:MAG: DUF928 domain-containing protein [Leptolyngbyaceae cyanobacterium bins.302]|nr:DUF928 domain-containing protein [Leptolyngbyaceae cyanobacterium bins.302]